MISNSEHKYGFTFTAASLRPELLAIVGERYLQTGSWEETKNAILASNELQCRMASSGVRLERGLRQRIQTLNDSQIHLLLEYGSDVRNSLAWLAAVISSHYFFSTLLQMSFAKKSSGTIMF
jgi:hypothetical protein